MDNKVELLGYYGGDLSHACSAWTSTSRDLTPEKIERIPKLLKMLATDGHHTPFEKSTLHFLLTVDDATHIQIIKHRIGVSVNAESARYKELKDDKCYIPPDWPEEMKAEFSHMTATLYQCYHYWTDKLVSDYGFTRKRAKESARYFLPKANQLQLDIMFNWRSFMHFLGLRNKEDAQLEIKNVSEKMLRLAREIPENPFKYSLEAFGYESY